MDDGDHLYGQCKLTSNEDGDTTKGDEPQTEEVALGVVDEEQKHLDSIDIKLLIGEVR